VDVTHVCANANAIAAAANGAFDIVMAAMSLMDVEDYAGAIREASRVLADGGELVMSITHPCFFAPVSGWERDAAGGLLHFKVDRYFDRLAWEEKIAPHLTKAVIRRHRTLEDYMAGPLACGLVLREFIEGSVTDEELKRSRRFRKLARIPYFLFMRWRKPA
jgi:ubiquinone/menaquinone biosynthesis C-methylase UbiE